jgi:hypothetical protein
VFALHKKTLFVVSEKVAKARRQKIISYCCQQALSLHKFWQASATGNTTPRVHALSSAISTSPMENVPAAFFMHVGGRLIFFSCIRFVDTL